MDKNQKKISSLLVQDYLETILENFHDGIYITDSESNTVYLNHSYELISGLYKSEMLGKNMKDLVERGVISQSGTLVVLETGESYTTEQSFRTGKRAIITSTPIFEENTDEKNIIMVVTIVREITEIYSIRKELRRKEQQNRKYLQEVEKIKNEMNGNTDLVAVDKKSVSLVRIMERVAMVDNPILLSGEGGVGKEKLAGLIHKHSERSECALIPINFSIIPNMDLPGYLLGYVDEKTGEYKMGIFESAERGTIYIEEIMDIPVEYQGILLDILKGATCVFGDGNLHRPNVRIIAGSKYSLEVLKGKNHVNREILDIFSLFPLEIPPLRERKDDIIPLLNFYLNQYNRKTGENKKFDRAGYKKLLEYHWPGNVRELQNLVQRSAIISSEETIGLEDLFIEDNIAYVSHEQEAFLEKCDLKEEVAKVEAGYIEMAFQKYKNVREAAESLNLDASTFVRKRQRYEKMGLMKKQKRRRNQDESIDD